jgi:Raf kinase inhibitor-like YbhB/YbcL family protein
MEGDYPPMTRTRSYALLAAVASALALTLVLVMTSGSRAAGPSEPPPTAIHPNPYAKLPRVPAFTVTSTDVRSHQPMPRPQRSAIEGIRGGKDISPQLSWTGFPKSTKSFAISMYDPDAPTMSGFWHWVVIDVPASTTSLPTNAGAKDSTTLPKGAIQMRDDAGLHQYLGAAPPPGSGVHNYYITVTALNTAKVDVPANSSAAVVGSFVAAHAIARGFVVPTAAPDK